MKYCAYLLTLVAILLWISGPAVSSPNQLFSLTITPPQEPLKTGTELRLVVKVMNTSDHSITFISSSGTLPEDGLLYRVTVRDEVGRPAPSSLSVRTADKHVPVNYGSRVARTLKPGESFLDEVTATDFYDLSKPGRYTISVARAVPPRQNLGTGSIESNAITVTVIQ